jgi:predicted nucleic-acid-binding protein
MPSALTPTPPLIVRTLDTNVIVRLLVGDDPGQTPRAAQAFLNAIPRGGFYLPDVVLAEVAWVLRGYGIDRQARHGLLERLVRTRSVVTRRGVVASLACDQTGVRRTLAARPTRISTLWQLRQQRQGSQSGCD